MNIIDKIEKEKVDFWNEYGEYPEYLIISASDSGELAYEDAIARGLDSDDAYIHNLTKFRGLLMCVIFDKSFSGFILK